MTDTQDIIPNTMIITLKEILKKREVNVAYDLDESTLNDFCTEFGLKNIDFVKASFKCVPIAGQKGIALAGTLKASVIHACVVTFAPVPQSIDETISIHYTPDGKDDILERYTDPALAESSLMQNYDIEMLEEGQINIFDMIREYLSLSLLPHPRVANANFDGFTLGELDKAEQAQINKNIDLLAQGKQPQAAENPFASLAALKEKLNS